MISNIAQNYTKERNLSLDGLRVVFIILMILHHLDMFYDINIPSFTENYKKITFEFFFGVNFFFMLSGVGVVVGYKQKLQKKVISRKCFFMKRLKSIYPAYFLFLITSIYLFNINIFNNFDKLLANLFILQSFPIQGDTAFSYNSVSWCVSDLMFFYLFFASIGHLLDFSISFCFSVFVFCFIVINMYFFDGNNYVSMFYINPCFRLLEFLSGMCVALWFEKHEIVKSVKLQVLAVFVLIVFMLFGIYGNIPLIYRWSLYYLFPFVMLLYSFYGETRWSKIILGNIFMKNLSKLTLVIYLSHQQLLFIIKSFLDCKYLKIIYDNFIPIGVFIICIFSIVVSFIVYILYIRPIKKLLSK